jgi:hypothetical protein
MRTTSSSISNSDSQGDEGAWRQFAGLWAVFVAALLSTLLAGAYAVDPYDSGRSSLLARPGVRPQGPRTAGASRGRDPGFDAAVIGNSHIQLVSPERLDALTGLSFVQLSVPATGPKEQLVLIDWFARHHREARGLVIGADRFWCTGDPSFANEKPFPFWLYSRNRLEYARGLLRYDVLEEVPRRVGYVLAKRPERARPDGYWDYEPLYLGMGYGSDPAPRARLEQRASDDYVPNRTGRFPATHALRAVLRVLDPEIAVAIVFPPVYASLLPPPGTAGAVALGACKKAFQTIASERRLTAVVDWDDDRPEAHDPELFFDQTHYRRPIATLLVRDIASVLKGGASVGR